MTKYEIKHGETKLNIDSHGAWITSLSSGGRDIFYQFAKLDDGAGKTKLRGGCHVCLPNFGADATGRLGQHGFGRTDEWSLIDQTDDSLSLKQISDHEGYEGLESILNLQLGTSALNMELATNNTGSESMRLAPAFHPYFKIGSASEISVNGQIFAVDQCAGTEFVEANQIDLKIADIALTLTSDNLNTWALWSDNLGDYFCVEPTFGGSRFLQENPKSDELLPPGQSKSYGLKIEW